MDNNGAHYVAEQQRRHGPAHLAVPPNVDDNAFMHQFQGMNLSGINMPAGPAPLPIGANQGYMVSPDGQFVIAPTPAAQHMGLGQAPDNAYNAFHVNGAYANPYVGLPFHLMPFTPGRVPVAHARLERGHSDVPELENRRDSYSPSESAPATPFYGGSFARGTLAPRVASLDRSEYTTPSPQQLGVGHPQREGLSKSNNALVSISDRALDELINQEPVIPKAVPAVFTPVGQMKSLEQSLENRIPGNRNVYIRGLHPTTDDALLLQFASRFGNVETSKAIIDTGTSACKGFGFAKFVKVKDSETCIRGFHRLGYEVGFARESFNSRLKAEGDDNSTNLYISNLPKSMNEVELAAIFREYTILSSKILRDNMGNSRGVGFARFESREVCDDVIHKYNGTGVGDDGYIMNIRYADTPAQKELKRVTAERRQFRTNEYNIGAYGTSLVGMSPGLYSQHQWRRSPTVSGPASSTPPSQGFGGVNKSVRSFTTVASQSTDAAIATPTPSDCDESVTIHADTVVVGASLGSSPSAKKEVVADNSDTKEAK